MTEYIDREAALNFEIQIEANPDDIQAISTGMSLYAEHIKSIPTADVVEQKHGKWIYNPKDAIEMMFTLPECSVCRHESSDAKNFCTNCGARMNA